MAKTHSDEYEVELRAIVPESEISKLRRYCEEHGEFVVTDNRFFVDYSTFLESVESRESDIRVRTTNGRREIILKKGGLGDSGRLENSLFIESGTSLQQVLSAMAIMGFKKGVAGIRTVHRYTLHHVAAQSDHGKIEVAIQEVRYYSNPDKTHSCFVEIEIMTSKAGQATAEQAVRQIFDELRLRPLSADETYAYIHKLNDEANGIFDFAEPNWDLIAQIGATM